MKRGDISSASGSTISDLFDKEPVYADHIAVFTLDYFKETAFKNKNIDLLKIDAENGELEVLEGALQTIAHFKPFVIIEILPIVNENTVQKVNERKAEMQKIMEQIGYQYYKIVINAKDEFTGLKEITNIADETAALSEFHYDFNYLIVPAEKKNFIKNLTLS